MTPSKSLALLLVLLYPVKTVSFASRSLRKAFYSQPSLSGCGGYHDDDCNNIILKEGDDSFRTSSSSSLSSSVVTTVRLRRPSRSVTIARPTRLQALRRRKNNNDGNNESTQDGSDNTNATPYVPSGLTLEEYTKIKQKEQEELSKKNFGMWGPRFSPTNKPPDGDWMLMPSLWTGGFDVDNNGNYNRNGGMSGEGGGRRRRWSTIITTPCLNATKTLGGTIRRYGPAFILAFASIDFVITGACLARSSNVSVSALVVLAVRLLIMQQQQADLLVKSVCKINAVKSLIAISLILPMERYIEHMNRRHLWTRKRTVMASILTMFGAVMLWAVSISAFRQFVSIVARRVMA